MMPGEIRIHRAGLVAGRPAFRVWGCDLAGLQLELDGYVTCPWFGAALMARKLHRRAMCVRLINTWGWSP